MKTFAALIRRYVLATAAIVLLVGGLLVGQIFYVGFKSNAVDATGYRVGALADALKQTETGLQWGREHTPAEWMQGYAWAMVLDDNGNVIWQQDLPQKLNHRYTASEVAVFSHWYLADYPVQCWAADYGLFVVAEPVGTCWKYNIDMKQKNDNDAGQKHSAHHGGAPAGGAGVLPVLQLAREQKPANRNSRAGYLGAGRYGQPACRRLCGGACPKAERNQRAAAPPQ